MNYLRLQMLCGWGPLFVLIASPCAGSRDGTCPGDCFGHGVCMVGGDCLCERPWGGRDCNFLLHGPPLTALQEVASAVDSHACLGGCSGRGSCYAGVCYCEAGFFGPTCADVSCPNQCWGHGSCDGGRCRCEAGWAGEECEVLFVGSLPGANVGLVDQSATTFGASAATVTGFGKQILQTQGLADMAPASEPIIDPNLLERVRQAVSLAKLSSSKAEALAKEASKRAEVAKEKQAREAKEDASSRIQRAVLRARNRSETLPGHEFADSRKPNASKESLSLLDPGTHWNDQCSASCSGHGRCGTERSCVCDAGFQGRFCDMRACTNDCSGHGLCVDARCLCDSGYFGDGCSFVRCPNDCGGNGYCFDGRCQCTGDWGGDSCTEKIHSSNVVSFKLPKKEPNIKGIALAGFSSVRALPGPGCPGNCSQHGVCHLGRECHCDADWFGTDCADYCPHSCSGHGECLHGSCLCVAGFAGPACNKEQCCTGHGSCNSPDGSCECDSGWTGDECNIQLVCPDPLCSNHGVCSHGKCYCSPGYSGPTCGNPRPSCDLLCGENGVCNATTSICDCKPGWAGRSCSLQVENECPADCSGHGNCFAPYCSCYVGWLGERCDRFDEQNALGFPSSDCGGVGGNLSLLDLSRCGGKRGFDAENMSNAANNAVVDHDNRARGNIGASLATVSAATSVSLDDHIGAAAVAPTATDVGAADGRLASADALGDSPPAKAEQVSLSWLRPAVSLDAAVRSGNAIAGRQKPTVSATVTRFSSVDVNRTVLTSPDEGGTAAVDRQTPLIAAVQTGSSSVLENQTFSGSGAPRIAPLDPQNPTLAAVQTGSSPAIENRMAAGRQSAASAASGQATVVFDEGRASVSPQQSARFRGAISKSPVGGSVSKVGASADSISLVSVATGKTEEAPQDKKPKTLLDALAVAFASGAANSAKPQYQESEASNLPGVVSSVGSTSRVEPPRNSLKSLLQSFAAGGRAGANTGF